MGQGTSGAPGSSGATRAPGATSESIWPDGAAGAIRVRTRALELNGSSTSSGTASSQSFRSSWQQIVDALDDTADEGAPASTGTGKSRTDAAEESAISSFVKGNPPRDVTASQAIAETLQSINSQFGTGVRDVIEHSRDVSTSSRPQGRRYVGFVQSFGCSSFRTYETECCR